MSVNERLLALKVLKRVVIDKQNLSLALEEEKSTAPFVKALCFGLCRYYFALNHLAEHLVDKKSKDEEIWLIILLGLYQLQYSTKKEHAIVHETVDLVPPKKKWARGFVNAILRRYLREKDNISTSLSIQNHPAWLVKRLKKDWPNQWQAILVANDAHPPFTLRVNQQKISRDAYLSMLKTFNLAARPLEHTAVGLVLESPCDIEKLPGFKEGLISVQEEAAQYAIPLLDLKPGLRVLDACAAPGGKLCHMLEAEPKLKDCVGLDIDKNRLARISANLGRLALKATLLQGDGRKPETWWDQHPFDRILLDAPCSALGVIRRHPDIKLLRREEDIHAISAIQRDLLEVMWGLLKEDGLLVYATCSLIKEENSHQIEAFLKKHNDAELAEVPSNLGFNTGHGMQILPGQSNCDGFFYAAIKKVATPS